MIVILILFAFGQGRGTKNIIFRPVKGIASLFNITSYLSNTLSYARLLALALATGVIASVVNLIAFMFGNSLPVIGPAITVLILLLGHGFNIGLNILGTFINVARLHLVEFFPRFFEAKGVQFVPKTHNLTYATFAQDVDALDLNLDGFMVADLR